MDLVDGMVRAARLDTSLYEEVERDRTQTTNALIVVVLASVAGGISTMSQAASPVLGLIAGVVATLIGWAVWSGFVYLVGTRLFSGVATWGEVLRTVGFANSPGLLRIFGFIPVLGRLIDLAVLIWTIVAVVVAVRQALDVSTGRAILSAIIGGILAAIVNLIILSPFIAAGMTAAP